MSHETPQTDGLQRNESSRVILRIVGFGGNEVPFSKRGAGVLYRRLHDHVSPIIPDLRVACDKDYIYVDAIAPTPNQLGVLNGAVEEVDTALLASYLLPAEISAARMSTNIPDLETPYAWEQMCQTPGTNVTSLAKDILSSHRNQNVTDATSNYIQASALDLFNLDL